MKLLKIFTLISMVAAGTVPQDNKMASTANSDVAELAAGLEALPEERQRRFWVRFFLLETTTMMC